LSGLCLWLRLGLVCGYSQGSELWFAVRLGLMFVSGYSNSEVSTEVRSLSLITDKASNHSLLHNTQVPVSRTNNGDTKRRPFNIPKAARTTAIKLK